MIPNPHDALVKAVLGKPEHAQGVLRAVLPEALAEALNWSTLTLRPGSFVDLALKEQHTDLLYSATWRDGSELLVYFLFEHLSAPPKKDSLLAFRLLRYQVRIWENWLAKHQDAKSLPMIIPIVMYHGVTPWSEPRLFDALLDVPASVRPAVAPYLIQFAYLLNDLSEITDDELRSGAMRTALAKLATICLKHARTSADFIQVLVRWMDVVRDVARAPNGLNALAQVLCYVLEVNDHVKREALQALLERELGPEAKEAIVTAGQQLIEQGRQEGLREGLRQGECALLLRQLRRRFGNAVNADIEQRIATAPIEQIDTWADRVFSAATLAELLAD
ncbi:MAG TPA: Rpn family recombination-promoting nuclease/putative transposase [Kofleriaceae bacterium]|nr:Rpn family recombination-promoting nuclease/putative transposase [Kofleriaceae bacterium]